MDVKKKAQDNVPENTPETASEQEVVQETQEVQKEQKEQEPTAEEKLQKQIDELKRKLLRTLAEYDNYANVPSRKRMRSIRRQRQTPLKSSCRSSITSKEQCRPSVRMKLLRRESK